MNGFFRALGFLTVIPIRRAEAMDPEGLGRAAGWFPIIGLILGMILAFVAWILTRWVSAAVVGALITGLWAILTGGLHLDGIADCCDGLFVSAPTERRLEIMNDARLGTFGTMGLIFTILLKSAVISTLAPISSLVLAPVVGRWMIIIAATNRLAKAQGMGASFNSGLTRRGILAATIAAVIVSSLFGRRGLIALALVTITALLFIRFVRSRLGGVTGDVLGAVCEIAELAVLMTFSIRADL